MLTMWISQNRPERRPRLPRGSRSLAPQRHRFRPRLEGLEERTVLSTLTVLNTLDKGAGSLRATIKSAQSGDTIVFAPSLDGQTITLTSGELAINKSLDIEGPGASNLAISGNNASRVFKISQDQNPVDVTIAGLTIENGLDSGGDGGGILNHSSTLTLNNDVLSNNDAVGSVGNVGSGGAISNRDGGTLSVSDCTFSGNQAQGGSSGGNGYGGALYNLASATVTDCVFTANQAVGGDGGVATNKQSFIGLGQGGAIGNFAGNLTLTNSTFTGNEATGGKSGSGGSAKFSGVDSGLGGAVDNDDLKTFATIVISGCTFTGNEAVGGSNATSSGGNLGDGRGGAFINFGIATVTNSTFNGNAAQGGSGNVGGSTGTELGAGLGGAICNRLVGYSGVSLTASNLTISNNKAIGGAGNTGGAIVGAGVGGGLENDRGATATVTGSTFTNNSATGSAGGAGQNGGDGLGGAIANIQGSSLTVSGCALSGDQAIGGAGGAGANGGNGLGGGAYNDGQSSLKILTSTISGNQAEGGAAGTGGNVGLGEGGGLYLADGGVACLDTFTQAHTTNNQATTDHDDIFGSFTTC